MEDANKLMAKANNGDQDAIKKLVQYFKNLGDEENAEYYESLLDTKTSINVEKKVEQNTKEIGESISNQKQNIETAIDGSKTVYDILDTYESYSIKELKDKESKDAFACFELSDIYFKAKNYSQGAAYCKKTIELLEIKSELCKTEKELACFAYTNLGCSLFLLENSHANKEYLLNLQNATEIPCDEKYKHKAYEVLSCIYKGGLGVPIDDKKGDEYLIKANSYSKEGCLKIAIKYYANNNLIDYQYWLESAISFKPKESEHYLQHLIEMKLAICTNNATINNIVDGTSELVTHQQYAKCLSSKEIEIIDKTLANECQKSDLVKNKNNDILCCACLGSCLVLKKASNEIIDFVKKYLIISKNNIFFESVVLSQEGYSCFFDILANQDNNDALNWLEEVTKANQNLDLSGVLEAKKNEYLKKLELEKQEQLKLAEEEENRQKELAELEKQKQLKLIQEKRSKRLKVGLYIAVVIFVFLVYFFVIRDGVDREVKLIDSSNKNYIANTTSYFGTELNDVVSVVGNYYPEVEFTYKPRYTKFSCMLFLSKDVDPNETYRYEVEVDNTTVKSGELNVLSEGQEIDIDITGSKSVTIRTYTSGAYLIADAYLLDSEEQSVNYKKNVAKYFPEAPEEADLKEADIIGSTNYIENDDGSISLNGDTNISNLYVRTRKNYKFLSGIITVPKGSDITTITIDGDGDTLYKKTINPGKTKKFSIPISNAQAVTITANGGTANFIDAKLGQESKAIETVDLTSLTPYECNYFSVHEEVTSKIGNTYSNVYTASYGGGESSMSFFLNGEYTGVELSAVTSEDTTEFCFISIYGDGKELYSNIIKNSSEGVSTCLSLKGVSDLKIVTAPGYAIISDAVLHTDEEFLNECDKAESKTNLYSISWIKKDVEYDKYSYLTDCLGNEILSPIYKKSHYFDTSYIEAYIDGVYTKVEGNIYYLADYDNNEDIAFGSCMLEIYGDDKLLYSYTINDKEEPQKFNVDVSSVKTIRFELSKEYESSAYGIAINDVYFS